jgi:hypothetical protein
MMEYTNIESSWAHQLINSKFQTKRMMQSMYMDIWTYKNYKDTCIDRDLLGTSVDNIISNGGLMLHLQVGFLNLHSERG